MPPTTQRNHAPEIPKRPVLAVALTALLLSLSRLNHWPRPGDALLRDAAVVGLTQEEDGEWGLDQQDMFDRVVFFLAALTCRLCSDILGADEVPFRAVMGKRGDAGAAAGAAARGASSCGVTTVAASASETPSRCARAVRERAGVSPRVRSAACSAGKRT
jgi:hypothetical protein